MKNKKAVFSSERMDWETPDTLFDAINNVFRFEIDLCANGDKNDFDRYNLIKMTKREAMRMYTQKKMTSNKELTKVNYAIVKLETKIKDLERNS